MSGDFNGDGLADLAISSVPVPIPPVTDVPKITVFLGDTGARLVRPNGVIPTGDNLGALALGDMNEDGAVDLIAAGGFGVSYVRVMPGDGTGTFSLGETFPLAGGSGLAVGDFNGDSHLDLAAANGTTGLSVLFGDGQGHLGPGQSLTTTALTEALAGDLNGDGRSDIVGILSIDPNTPEPLLVFMGNADGTFTAVPPQPTGHNIILAELGDMNEDGHLDVVGGAPRTGGPNVLTFLGRGDGTFDTVSPPAVDGGVTVVGLGDVDGDGHLDALSFSPAGTFQFCPPNTPLYFHHGRGDGTLADGVRSVWTTNSIEIALGDTNGDGFLDAALPGCGFLVVRPGGPNGLGDVVNAARAFTIKNNDVIRLNANKSTWCVHVEGVNGSLDVTRESLINVAVFSTDTGSQTSVLSNSKERVIVDSDANGVTDQEFCFPKDQLRQLFSGITGTQTVNVTIEGNLNLDGCRFRAPLSVTVISGGGGQAAAAMNPNVFSTSSVLSFQTARGQVRARIYDVSGRLVKTLMDGAAEAGPQRVRVEARDTSGKALPSGVYFFRIDSPKGLESGRFVIAR